MDSAPSKITCSTPAASAASSESPQLASTSDRRAPPHLAVDMAPPQLQGIPIVVRTALKAARPLPPHWIDETTSAF